MAATESSLITQAETIRDESSANANTATRVGTFMRELMTWLVSFFVPISTPAALTDGASVTVDADSKDNKMFTLDASNTTFTFALSNLADGHTFQIFVTPQSTATFTATFTHTGLTCKVAGAASAVWAFDATSGEEYRVFATRKGSNVYVSPDSRPY